MKKILIINTIGMGYEGISTVIFNYLEHMDRNDFDFHFPIFQDTNTEIISKIRSLGVPHMISNRKQNLINYLLSINEILKEGYDVVHIHGNSGTMLFEVLISKINRVKKIIVHCHNTKTDHPFLNAILKKPMIYFSDELLACSKISGDWLYRNHPYIVLKNAINIKKFIYNAEKRKIIRESFGFKSEDFVIGHVGHFTKQKNHTFLIDIFSEIHKQKGNVKLLLVSDGPLEKAIRDKIDYLNLSKYVVFAGRRNDVCDIYNAMDFFIIPSLWEGLSLVTLEAQTNGLQVLASKAIPEEVKCTNKIYYASVDENPKIWAEKFFEIISSNKADSRFEKMDNYIKNNNFDIELESDKLKSIYNN